MTVVANPTAVIEQELQSQEGRDAFSKLKSLTPNWTYIKAGADKLYISPDLIVKFPEGNGGSSPPCGWGSSVDGILVKFHACLLEMTKPETEKVVLANAFSDPASRQMFRQDARGNFFKI